MGVFGQGEGRGAGIMCAGLLWWPRRGELLVGAHRQKRCQREGPQWLGILLEWTGGTSVPAAKLIPTTYPSQLVTETGPGNFPPSCDLSDTGSCSVF